MLIDPTVSLGNLLTVVSILGGVMVGLFVFVSKFNTLLYRVSQVERRLNFMEQQNTLPIQRRRIARQSDIDGERHE